MKNKWVIILSVIAIGVVFLFLGLRNRDNNNAVIVQYGKINQIVAATGKIEGVNQAELSAKITGRIKRILVKERDIVKTNQPLVLLDSEELDAQVKEAETVFSQAERNYKRAKNLFGDGIISKKEYDDSEDEYKRTKASLEYLKAMLANTIIRAPFSGTIVRKYKEEGEVISSLGTPETILLIADVSKINAKVEVDESDIGKLRIGQRAYVTTDTYPGERFYGKIAKIGMMVGKKLIKSNDPKEIMDKKVLETEIELNPTEKLTLGMTVDAKIIVVEKEKALIVPKKAVQRDESGEILYVLNNGTKEKRKIKTGERDDVHVEVVEGVKEGEKISILPKE
ncbi:MAG: efflux RND transporter periplasmic adaptor subunit [Nitrospirota bacterium]